MVRPAYYAGPKLNTRRASHACERVTWQNASTGQYEDVVIVAGGFNDDQNLNSVEFLFLKDPSSGWTVGPDMPWEAYGQTMVEYQVSISPTFYKQIFVRKSIEQLFCTYGLGLYFLAKGNWHKSCL